MGPGSLRVAYFTDTYLEINGVANTARNFEAYARRHAAPFLMLHGGYHEEKIVTDGPFTRVELPRSRFGFTLDRQHEFDVAFMRHLPRVERLLRAFRPDVLHITGPSDVGMLGALAAHRLHIPLVASWHTNVHEYAERRAMPLFFLLPQPWRRRIGHSIRDCSFLLASRFYKIPRVLMAPNRELIALLEKSTGKSCFLMARGVDTELFHPSRRQRLNSGFTIGYVGRITVEKNVESLIEVEQALLDAGVTGYQFLVVGQGASEAYLRSSLRSRSFAGVLHGVDLAHAYANMDAFLFPSKTDTFGNVVLEAMASGVPALVSDHGGPQFILRPGVSGYVCGSNAEFAQRIQQLMQSPELLQSMRAEARKQAEAASWDTVFAAVYRAYQVALQPAASRSRLAMEVAARVTAKP
jgi:glycosyltransferase involved in cell wall biosynthesis